MAKIKGAITVTAERCKGCNLCVVACPSDVLALQPQKVNQKGYNYAYMANPDNCIGCASCGIVCPDGCIDELSIIDTYVDLLHEYSVPFIYLFQCQLYTILIFVSLPACVFSHFSHDQLFAALWTVAH